MKKTLFIAMVAMCMATIGCKKKNLQRVVQF